ncbi:MAG: bifunctional biotin--[acetyl-CoA-carboxylase] ligase/biotin operon repressor BirA [Pseudomonadales bacterium]
MSLEKILGILADGQFHSGEELSQVLEVSRTSVWKHIAKLDALGLQVNAVRGKGYRLRDRLDLLALPAIYEHLDESAFETFSQIELHLTTASTNRLALDASKSPYVCLAEMQTAGRGRRGREWVSPFAKNIYLSVAWRFGATTASLDSLSLCVAISIARALEALGCRDLGVKWPNDLLYKNKKLAGILLEASGELGGAIRVVIGVGINVTMTEEQGALIDQAWISLRDLLPTDTSRSVIVAELLNKLAQALPAFEQYGFAAFDEDWRRFDCLVDKPVELSVGNKKIAGMARGVDSTGGLLIEQDDQLKAYRGGEVSVRAKAK